MTDRIGLGFTEERSARSDDEWLRSLRSALWRSLWYRDYESLCMIHSPPRDKPLDSRFEVSSHILGKESD